MKPSLCKSVRNVVTLAYIVYTIPFLFFLYWLVSVFVVMPMQVQHSLFGRQVSNPYSLTYFGDSWALDGMFYEWEFRITEPEYLRLKPRRCERKLLPRLGKSDYYSFPYCRIYSKEQSLNTKGSRMLQEAYVPLDRPTVRLVYDRGQK